jgi:hypothetical protein
MVLNAADLGRGARSANYGQKVRKCLLTETGGRYSGYTIENCEYRGQETKQIMNLAHIERLRIEMQRLLEEAGRQQAGGLEEAKRRVVDTAIAHFERMRQAGYRPKAEEIDRLHGNFRSLGYSEEESSLLLSSKKKKKIDLLGRSSGGSEHTSEKSPSKTGRHQKGKATKRKSYGGEKGDERRPLPRRRYRGYKGPWPPPDDDEPADEPYLVQGEEMPEEERNRESDQGNDK